MISNGFRIAASRSCAAAASRSQVAALYRSSGTRLRCFASAVANVAEDPPAEPPKVVEPESPSFKALDNNLRPSEVVKELNKHIVGQEDAKKAVAIAMRNRWRRMQLPDELKKEVTPRNVLLVGPTGCGKTEVARRMAMLNDAPFRTCKLSYIRRDPVVFVDHSVCLSYIHIYLFSLLCSYRRFSFSYNWHTSLKSL